MTPIHCLSDLFSCSCNQKTVFSLLPPSDVHIHTPVRLHRSSASDVLCLCIISSAFVQLEIIARVNNRKLYRLERGATKTAGESIKIAAENDNSENVRTKTETNKKNVWKAPLRLRGKETLSSSVRIAVQNPKIITVAQKKINLDRKSVEDSKHYS